MYFFSRDFEKRGRVVQHIENPPFRKLPHLPIPLQIDRNILWKRRKKAKTDAKIRIFPAWKNANA